MSRLIYLLGIICSIEKHVHQNDFKLQFVWLGRILGFFEFFILRLETDDFQKFSKSMKSQKLSYVDLDMEFFEFLRINLNFHALIAIF